MTSFGFGNFIHAAGWAAPRASIHMTTHVNAPFPSSQLMLIQEYPNFVKKQPLLERCLGTTNSHNMFFFFFGGGRWLELRQGSSGFVPIGSLLLSQTIPQNPYLVPVGRADRALSGEALALEARVGLGHRLAGGEEGQRSKIWWDKPSGENVPSSTASFCIIL